MNRQELEVYSDKTNQAIVRMPNRTFPGIVLQGDSLSCIFWKAMAILEELDSGDLAMARQDALSLAEGIQSDIEHYEQVLGQQGVDLPYDRDPDRTTEKYEHFRLSQRPEDDT